MNGNSAACPAAAKPDPRVAFDPAVDDAGVFATGEVVDVVGGVNGAVVVVGVVVVVVVVVVVCAVGGVPALGGVSVDPPPPPPPPVVVVQLAEVPPKAHSSVTCAWRSVTLVNDPGGVAVAIRSTWKKQFGTVTDRLYGPPVLKTPLVFANSVCANENPGRPVV